MKNNLRFLVLGILIGIPIGILSGCSKETKQPAPETLPIVRTPLIGYSVVKVHPHDTMLFTEGLLFYKGQLLESTGSPEGSPYKSLIGISDIATGKFTKKIELDKMYFGEGICVLQDKLYQLTYQHQQGFIYDANTFKRLGMFPYSNKEGWGFTTDGSSLIMSDGTYNLSYLDPKTLARVKMIPVTENGRPQDSLNELEMIKGYIYANVWQSDIVVRIEPSTGNIVGKIDLGSLSREARAKNPHADVMNGIAYNPLTDKIYVTGKLWANIYEIQFDH